MKWLVAMLILLPLLGGTVANTVAEEVAAAVALGENRAFQETLPLLVAAAQDFEEAERRLGLITAIAKAAFYGGDTSTARDLLAQAAEQARQATTPFALMLDLKGIALAYIDIGDAKAAQALFAEVAVAATGDDSTLLQLAAAEADADQLESALVVAQSIELAYYRAPALSAVAKAHGKSGDFASATSLVNEALATINQIPESGGLRQTQYASVLSDIALIYVAARSIEGARDAIAKSQGDRNWPMRLIARALAERGDIDNALLIAADIGAAQQSYAQQDIISALVASGDFARAIETANALFPDGTVSHDEAVVVIASAQARGGDPDGARVTASDVLLAGSAPARTPDASDPASLWVSEGAMAAPHPDDGIGQIVGDAIWKSAARDDPETSRKDIILAAIAAAEAKAGELETALATMQGISGALWRMSALIDFKIAADRPREALAAALSPDDPADRAWLLAQLVEGLTGR